MTSVPVRSIRSTRPCRNSTVLIRRIGMSMPDRVMIPLRNITRRSVSTKCVVFQDISGRTKYQQKPMAQTAATAMSSTVCGVDRNPDDVMTPRSTPAAAVRSPNKRNGPSRHFQCGCRWRTTRSPDARFSRG